MILQRKLIHRYFDTSNSSVYPVHYGSLQTEVALYKQYNVQYKSRLSS